MKYRVSIKLIFDNQYYSFVDSPLFNTMEEAKKWYKDLRVTNEHNQPYDIILIEYDENDNIRVCAIWK